MEARLPALTLLGLNCGCRKIRSALGGRWVPGTLHKQHSPPGNPSKNGSITKNHWYRPCVTMRGDETHSLLFMLLAFALIVSLVLLPGSASTMRLFSCGAGGHRQLPAPRWWWCCVTLSRHCPSFQPGLRPQLMLWSLLQMGSVGWCCGWAFPAEGWDPELSVTPEFLQCSSALCCWC